jgi:predicted nucleic acid-binding protein
MIVVDTNLIGYLLLPGERSAQAEAAFRTDPRWAAPLLWRSELRNVLALYMRRRQLGLDGACRVMAEAAELMAGEEYDIDSAKVLELAEASGCSAYDCEFVALALDLCIPLVTVDRQVLSRFPNVAVSLDKFIAA